ncbi:MAG: hypothetical protein ACYS3N_01455 [Planctomycetota bacterium]
MHPAKRRRRRKNRDITRAQTIHRLLISVETDESVIPRYVHFPGVPSLQILVTAFQAMFEHVTHGNELHRTSFYRQGVVRCAGAPAATAYQGHLDSVALPGIHTWSGRSHKS